jgi:hypothetical protein
MIVKWCVMPVVAAVLLLAPQGQEPKPDRPPPPPAGQPPLPPVEEPYVEPVQRLDLPERFATRDPLEGIWEVRLRSIGGRQEAVTAGHMVIGRRLLIVHFEAPGVKPEVPLLRACTYTWARTGRADTVQTTVIAGHFNVANGDINLEQAGTVELRRFELLDGGLRVHQDNGDWTEFARVE